MRIGIGYDIHKLTENRDLILGRTEGQQSEEQRGWQFRGVRVDEV